ncbi:hypothetical protein GCM10007415_30080 [Parapedobacter pyrenivorans]|uniref:Uncharacterized protein n=1 Tax=Parapedobacter pyrenivorans TaxID=1305674 RepID=A0A917HW03_9SPHI|nr:hypothetical protein GCM10007415_30080 [Parapedobacter pyrenivorans]
MSCFQKNGVLRYLVSKDGTALRLAAKKKAVQGVRCYLMGGG